MTCRRAALLPVRMPPNCQSSAVNGRGEGHELLPLAVGGPRIVLLGVGDVGLEVVDIIRDIA